MMETFQQPGKQKTDDAPTLSSNHKLEFLQLKTNLMSMITTKNEIENESNQHEWQTNQCLEYLQIPSTEIDVLASCVTSCKSVRKHHWPDT